MFLYGLWLANIHYITKFTVRDTNGLSGSTFIQIATKLHHGFIIVT